MTGKYTVMSLIQPKIIRQQTRHRCWAAALESWLDAVSRQRPNQKDLFKISKQEDLIKNFGLPNGGLDSLTTLPRVASSVFMRLQWVSINQFNAEKIKRDLAFGPLYLLYKVDHKWSHAVVLYGVKESKEDEPQYMVMDPYKGYKKRVKAEFFLKLDHVGLGYPTAITIGGFLESFGFKF